MTKEISEAISLLQNEGYIVKKFTTNMDEDADHCAETGCGDCMNCSCFVCAAGLE